MLVETISAGDDPLLTALRSGEFRRLTMSESLRLGRPPSVGGARRRSLSGLVRRFPGGGYTGLMGRSIYREQSGGEYDSGLADLEGNVLFCGYFQNEQYFLEHAASVTDALVPVSGAASAHLKAIGDLGGDTESIAVVVRAGLDYVRIGWDLPLRWYIDAVELAVAEVARPSFAVFSDIPLCAEAVAESLRHFGPAHAIVGLDPVQQLHVMAQADHVVSASTSFGWWGAWLGDALRGFSPRTVVVPDPWITPGSQTPPARWSRLAAQAVSA